MILVINTDTLMDLILIGISKENVSIVIENMLSFSMHGILSKAFPGQHYGHVRISTIILRIASKCHIAKDTISAPQH